MAISLMKLILVAKNAFEAYLIISALRISVCHDRGHRAETAIQIRHPIGRLRILTPEHYPIRVLEVFER